MRRKLNTARKELKGMKTDIHINEAKEAAAKSGKTVFNAVTSVFNVGEVKAAKLKPITELFPEMENARENIEELPTMGIQNYCFYA